MSRSNPIFSEVNSSNTEPHEIDLTELLIQVWTTKWIISVTAVLAGGAGLVYCLLTTPLYYAQAILTPKKSNGEGVSSSILSQFGGIGGAFATQLGFGDNNLDKMEIILKSRELADSVISRNNLLPILFPDAWDEKTQSWKDTGTTPPPTIRKGVELLRNRLLSINSNTKKSILTVGVFFHDPEWAVRVANMYVDELNRRIRADVIRDAEFNQKYLQDQNSRAFDPLLKEKIQSLIAIELEKSMLVSSQSFSVLEKPELPLHKSRPRTGLTILIFGLVGVIGSMAYLVGRQTWAKWAPEIRSKIKKDQLLREHRKSKGGYNE